MGNDGNGRKTYVVFVGSVQEKFETSPVLASDLLKKAGAEPAEDFVLEALHGRQGAVQREYQSTESVDLDPSGEKFFRAVPRGGGRA